MAQIITTLGPRSEADLGFILPHEHVFVDLRTWDKPGYAQADADAVIALMGPEIARIGVGASGCGVVAPWGGGGGRADLDRAVSLATGLPIVVPTGIYREPWIPPWAHDAGEDKLVDWMRGELEGEIESSGVRAGWVKVSAGDDGLTDTERKILRAAAQAASHVNAVIGSHTIRAAVVREQLDIIEAEGYSPERFIWIHTQAEADVAHHLEIARRGAWIEYDGIGGWGDDETYLANIHHVLDAGLGDHLMLSHDRGWYDPALPGGGTPRPYTYLHEIFLPKLAASGVDADTIRQLTQHNPFRAFARD